jgi:hypothetical protein
MSTHDVWTYMADKHGRSVATSIQAAEFRSKLLVSELSLLWLSHLQAIDAAFGTTQQAATSIRQFIRFVDANCTEVTPSITGQGDYLGYLLVGWHQSLRANSITEKRYALVVTLLRRAEHGGAALQPSLRLIATQAQFGRKSGRIDEALDEFNNAERRLQTRVATADVQCVEERLERGLALYGGNEEFRGLIKFATMQTSYGSVLDELRSNTGLVAAVERAYGAALPAGRDAARLTTRILGLLISPSPLELISFHVLIQWASGVAPEQVRDLRLNDMTFDDVGVTWLSRKNRAHKDIRMVFRGNEPWRVAGLLRRLNGATRLAREFAGIDRSLTTFTGIATNDARALAFKQQPLPNPTLKGWFTHHSLEMSAPYDFRRIRKTHTAIRAGITETAELAAQPDHSIHVFLRHYASTRTSLVRSGQTIIQAQERVVERALGPRARAIGSSAQEAASTLSTEGDIRSVAKDVAERSDVERSLTGSACSNPMNSPFLPAGDLCTKAPFACLLCPNAVIFNDHAPQLLLMRDSLEQQRLTVGPSEFAATGLPFADALDDYLGQMDAITLQEARAAVSSGAETLNLSMSDRIRL